MECIFCDKSNKEINTVILENDGWYARMDNFPVSKGHMEIVPKKHIVSLFEVPTEDITGAFELLKQTKDFLNKEYNPDGFNVGVNEGEVAGRCVHHLHIHVIPRYKDDVNNPKGGIRNIFLGKGDPEQ